MNTKDVNKAIREIVGPPLKDLGFRAQNSRDFYLLLPHAIQVINFQSFNTYMAKVLEMTPFSFCVNLGIYFGFVPNYIPHIKETEKKLPKEYECHFRWKLKKNIGLLEYPREDIWCVTDAVSCQMAVKDALHSILDRGIPWLKRYSNIDEAFNILWTQEEDYLGEAEAAGVGGIGNMNSPLRNFLLKAFREYLQANGFLANTKTHKRER